MGAAFTLLSGAISSVATGADTQSTIGGLIDQQRDEQAKSMQSTQAAVDATMRGRYEAGIARMKGSQLVAEQRLAGANSGVDTQSGTPANVMADTRLMSELDAAQIRNNATREAWGHKQEAAAASERAMRLRRKQGEAADAGALAQLGNFVGTTGKTYSAAMSSSSSGNGSTPYDRPS